MSISKTSLANIALEKLGQPTILSVEDDSEAARLVNDIFDQTLDEELEEHDWSFARGRAQLAAETTTPAFGWNYSHVMPASPYCLHVLSEHNGYDYTIEGRNLLSDDTPLQIIYTYRVTDLNHLSAVFRKMFCYRLASEMALKLTGSAKIKTAMENLYKENKTIAKSRDSMQGSPQDLLDDDDMTWANARFDRI